jgi:hypothetical protein
LAIAVTLALNSFSEVIGAEQAQGLEHHVRLGARGVHGIAPVPRAQEGVAAERIAPRPAQRMPVTHGKAQMLGHGLAQHHLLGIVPAEGQR